MCTDAGEARRFLEKWQGILRLRDWDIRLQMVEIPWRKTGDIKIDRDDHKAILLVNGCDPKQTNLEALVLHELLHLKLWDLDQTTEQFLHGMFGEDEDDPKYQYALTQFMTALESTVEDLAKSFLSLGGEDREPSFGRLQMQVDHEIGR